jgi:hypothetical protein
MKRLSWGSLCCQSWAKSSEKGRVASCESQESIGFCLSSLASLLRADAVMAVRSLIITISMLSFLGSLPLDYLLPDRDRDLDLDRDLFQDSLSRDALGGLDLDRLVLSLCSVQSDSLVEFFLVQDLLRLSRGLSFCRMA